MQCIIIQNLIVLEEDLLLKMKQVKRDLKEDIKTCLIGAGIIGASYLFNGCESIGNNMDSDGITLFRIEKNYGDKSVRKSGVLYDLHRKNKYNNY